MEVLTLLTHIHIPWPCSRIDFYYVHLAFDLMSRVSMINVLYILDSFKFCMINAQPKFDIGKRNHNGKYFTFFIHNLFYEIKFVILQQFLWKNKYICSFYIFSRIGKRFSYVIYTWYVLFFIYYKQKDSCSGSTPD